MFGISGKFGIGIGDRFFERFFFTEKKRKRLVENNFVTKKSIFSRKCFSTKIYVHGNTAEQVAGDRIHRLPAVYGIFPAIFSDFLPFLAHSPLTGNRVFRANFFAINRIFDNVVERFFRFFAKKFSRNASFSTMLKRRPSESVAVRSSMPIA